MSSDPSITIDINTKADLSAVEDAKGALDDLSSSLKEQPGIKIDKADLSGIEQAREAIVDLKGSSPITIDLRVNTDAINQAKSAASALGKPAANQGLDGLWKSAIASAESYGQTAKKAAAEAQSALSLDDLWDKSIKSSEDLDASIIKVTSHDLSKFNQSLGTGTGMVNDMSGQVGRLTAKIGKIAAGAAIFTAVYAAGKKCWQALFDYVNRYEIKAKEAVTRTSKAASDAAKEMWDANKSAYASIEQSGIKKSYEQEDKIVAKILKNYRDSVALVNNMAEAKQREIAADLKILESNKEKEKSIIRQKVLSGAMTQAQGDRAMLKVDAKTNDERRALERKSDEERVNAATKRTEAAETAVKELEERYRRMSRQEATAKSAEEYQKEWLAAAPAISNSAENKRLVAQRNAARAEITRQNQIKVENNGQSIHDLINREAAVATIAAKEEEIKQISKQIEDAEGKAKEISQYNAKTPIDQTGKTPEEIRDEIAGFLGDFDGWMKGLRDQLSGARDVLKSNRTDQDNAKDELVENDRTRINQKTTEKIQENERAAEVNKSLADRSLAWLAASSDKANQSMLTFADNVHNSQAKMYAYMRQGNPKMAEAVSLGEHLAKNGSSEAQLSKLSKLLKEAKNETPYEGVKGILENNIGSFIRDQSTLLKNTRANTGGGEIIKQTRDQFVDNVRGIRSNPDYQKKPDSKVEEYIRQTQQAISDNKLSKPEADKIRAMAVELARMTGNKAAQEAALALKDALSGMLAGQMKVESASAKLEGSEASQKPNTNEIDRKRSEIELNRKKVEEAYSETRRRITGSIDEVDAPLSLAHANTPGWNSTTGSKLKGMMSDGSVDGAEINELRAMLGEYKQSQDQSGDKSAYSEIISIVQSMISLGKQQAADESSLRDQIRRLQADVNSLKTSVGKNNSQKVNNR